MKDIREYQAATRDNFDRYAPSAGYLDWATQPDPFRRWAGCEKVMLPLSDPGTPRPVDDLFVPPNVDAASADLTSLGRFWQLSLGLSNWKGAGNQFWALRMNPSSGNLHPVEAHMLWPGNHELPGGLYHYEPHEHVLEQRRLSAASWPLGREKGFAIIFSTIHWRESWKYGVRAWRYCQLDLGHALASLSHAARILGWTCRRITDPSSAELDLLAGYNEVQWPEHEKEWPGALVWVSTDGSGKMPIFSPGQIETLAEGEALGIPSRLSEEHVDWALTDEVAEAAREARKKVGPEESSEARPSWPLLPSPEPILAAEESVRQRRSAQAFDPAGRMPREVFLTILDRVLPRPDHAPWDLDPQTGSLDLVIFVHKVDGLDPGIYALIRDGERLEERQNGLAPHGEWIQVEGGMPLFRLGTGDCRREAEVLSCRQAIAGQSCFSLGILAPLGDDLLKAPYKLAHHYHEAGLIGHVLYLAAEAWGFRGTGIGCFYDDPVRQFSNITDPDLHPLYHFTIGVPQIDRRLKTLAPYHHRNSG